MSDGSTIDWQVLQPRSSGAVADATTMESQENALQYHRKGWSVIPIIPGTKRPPIHFPLRVYFERAPTEEEIRIWFGRSPSSMAVCLGDVSDGLTCRDFDKLADYRQWKAERPRLAAMLPTVLTPRGAHVYCTTDIGDLGGREIIKGVDGELKRGGYTILPRSVHPTGPRYEWLAEFDDIPFVSDLERSGLLPPPRPCGTQEIYIAGDNCFSGRVTIAQAIELTQPGGFGERHHCLFQFIRLLKATELRDACEEELVRPLECWLKLAEPRIRTTDWKTNWNEFRDGWKRVRHPYGAAIAGLADRAASQFGGQLQGIEGLECLCRELQVVAGKGNAFHLDCRTAANVLGVGKSTANRWFQLLCQGPLECVFKGNHKTNRASEYRFRDQ